MRRRSFIGSAVSAPPGAVDKTAATVGSICISNGIDIWFMSLTAWQAYSGTEYQAIGVVTSAVGDCGDSYVRVCSIPYMNYNTPDVGVNACVNFYWNGYNTNIGGGITETTSAATAKVDYNGKRNTIAILAKATDQSNWRTYTIIYNPSTSATNTYFPTACCCWRFHTIGTNQGDWYLPSVGELYKAYQNQALVDPSLKALGMTMAYEYIYWASTSYDSQNAWFVAWYRDYVYSDSRIWYYGVRAFIQF